MRVLTLYQPWASLTELRYKKIEPRSWATKYRGPLLIHAAANVPGWARKLWLQEPFISIFPDTLPVGSIVALANLVDCIKIIGRTSVEGIPVQAQLENEQIIEGNELAFGDYTPHRFAWKLENVQRLKKPIPAKGYQRLWNWDETPYLVAIDPYQIGSTKIWTPKGVMSGRKLDRPDEDAVFGLEVA